MPSGLRETSNNHFEIYYEKPWGGVASDSDPVDLAPNQLVTQQGVAIVDGSLCQFNIVADPLKFLFEPHIAGALLQLIFELNGQLFAMDQFGFIYQYQNAISPNNFIFFVAAPGAPFAVPGNPPTAVQIVNNKAYIAVFTQNSTYVFDGGVIVLATNFVGGKVMGILDDQLLQLNVNQAVDGEQANRINWSAPGEFTTWDPAINRLAGFNTLASVEDQITGFLSFASVGIAVTEKGLVELSPTGVAIGPFAFTILWTSEIGQGCIFPDSITQYGQIGYLTTDSGVFALSTGGGFKDVSGVARTVIMDSFQPQNLAAIPTRPVAGSLMLYPLNANYPTPCYIMCAAQRDPVLGTLNTLVVWLLDVATGTWSQCQYDVDTLVNNQLGTALSNGSIFNLKVGTFDFDPSIFSFSLFSNPTTLVYMNVAYPSGAVSIVMAPYLFKSNTAPAPVNTTTPLSLVFRKEEVKLGREPTIRRVIVKAYGSGTLSVSVSGVSFGDIVLDGTMVAKTYLTQQGIFTGEDPQLSITSTNFQGVIIKAMMPGTYADGDID